MIDSITWRCSKLEQLDALSASQMYKLRQDVFIIEQACLYNDIDDLDTQALHLLGTAQPSPDEPDKLIAYSRILAPGACYAEPSIGRVLVDSSVRGQGLGRLLVEQGVRLTQEQFGSCAIRISAQQHLIKLYEDAGFESVGPGYVEDGIPHQEMLLPAS